MICAICREDDEMVLIQCRDGVTRCAHCANMAGYCWGCGEADPQWYGDECSDGLCHDCRSADVMFERKRRRYLV